MSPRPSAATPSDADEAFLDELFERFVDARAEGELPDRATLIVGREHLADAVDELWRLACGIAGSGPGAERVGGYELIEELGRGAMGVVWLARQENLGGRPVALKLLASSPTTAESDRRRFHDEAAAMARVHHPNVVPVHDVVQADGVDAFAMAWVQGGSLADLLRRRRAWLDERAAASDGSSRGGRERAGGSARQGSSRGGTASTDDLARLPARRWVPFVCRVGVQLGRAVQAVHDAGLLHRDVKPSNVLLRRDGTPLLSDFGLVRDPERTRHTAAGFLGTLSFAAPEQVRGETATAAADVYALGATLYYALSQALPVEGSTEGAVLRALEQRGVTPLRSVAPELPRDLVTVVEKALQLEPGERYASAAELADDLERVLSLQPVRARPQTVLARARSWVRRNRRVVAAAGAAAVVVAALAGLWMQEAERRRELPGRVAALARDARLALLDTELQARTKLGLDQAGPVFREMVAARAERALEHYDAALALDPSARGLALERRVTALALAHMRDEPPAPALLDGLAEDWPRTAAGWRALSAGDVTRTATSGDSARTHADGAAQATDADDLRALGLLAWLVGDVPLCHDAWRRLERHGQADPFVDGLLGHAHLALDRPAQAYPRLLRAAEAFPRAGFLLAAAARAALVCGDTEVARRLHARAADAELPAAPNDLLALQADLLWVDGRPDEAVALYESERLAAVYERGAARSMLRGELATVVFDGSTMVSNDPDDLELGRLLVRAARRWWAAADRARRAELLRAGLRGERGEHGHVFGVLAQLQDVCARVAASLDPDAPVVPFRLDGERALFDRELAGGGRRDAVDGFATRVDARRLDVQRLMTRPELHGPLVQAWLDGDDAAAEQLLADAGARLPPGAHAFGPPRAPLPAPLRVLAEVPGVSLDFARMWQPFHGAAGDVDGDGWPDLLLGAEGHGPRSGRALVLSGRDGAVLHELLGERFERLGTSVVWLGDVDGDGTGDWAVGSDRSLLHEPQRVRVVSGATGAVLRELPGEPGDGPAASALAGLGDVDGDGVPDLAVGCGFAEGPDGPWTGRLRALSAGGRELWRRDGTLAGGRYGHSLSTAGDVDGDGVLDLLVRGDSTTGAAPLLEVLSGRDGATLHALDLGALESPAVQLTAPGDVDGDGALDVLVHSSTADGLPRVEARSVRDGRALAEVRGPPINEGFGLFSSMLGDLDGDGRSEWCVSSLSGRSPVRPRVRVYSGDGALLAELEGFVWLRRLGHDPLLPAPENERLVAIGLDAWSRYAPRPVGGPARIVLLEWD